MFDYYRDNQKSLNREIISLQSPTWGKIYTENGWLIRVQGNEHPPIHVHVLHSNGKALITLDGNVKNSGVPAKVIKQAVEWIASNQDIIQSDWQRMNNPRGKSL